MDPLVRKSSFSKAQGFMKSAPGVLEAQHHTYLETAEK